MAAMDAQDLAIAVASMEASLSAMKEAFNVHTRQDMQQFEALNNSLASLDDKIDQLLLREAERLGEFRAVKRMSFVIAAAISGVINLVISFVG